MFAASQLLCGAPSPTGMSREEQCCPGEVRQGKEDAADSTFSWLKFEDVTFAALGKWSLTKNQGRKKPS